MPIWTPARGVTGVPYVLAQSAVAASHTGNTNETTLATVSIPGGAMGANGSLRITSIWSMTNSVNTKTPRIRLGGIGGTAYLNGTHTTVANYREQRQIANRNSQSSQVGFGGASVGSGGWGQTSVAATTSSVDTSAAVDLVFTAQLANSGETITLEQYIIEVIRG